MKKLLKVLLGLTLLFSLVGCSGNGSKDKPANDGPLTVEGVLKLFSGSLLTIDTLNGMELIFDVSDATIDTTHGLLAGDDIILEYEGTIKDKDTSGAIVKRVVDKSANDPEPVPTTIVGKVTDATMSSITLDTNHGTIFFNIALAEMDVTNGIQIGNTIYITYIGKLDGNDATNIQVLKVVDEEANAVVVAPTPKPTLTPIDQIKVTEKKDWEWMYAKEDTDIYAGNSKQYKKVGFLWQHQAIETTGTTSDGWTRVATDTFTGFILTEKLTTIVPPSNKPSATPTPKPTVAPTPVPKHSLTIQYKDTDGNTMYTDYQADVKEGASYNVSTPKKEGYTAQPILVSGVMGNENVLVQVIYYANPKPTEEPTPTPVATPEPTPEPTMTPNDKPVAYTTLTGYVVDADADTLTIDVEDQDYTFDVSKATKTYANGILIGNKVDVEYVGELNGTDTTQVMVSSVIDHADNDNIPHLQGAVIGKTQNTFTISTRDGVELIFFYTDKTDLQTSSGTIEEGTRILVCPDSASGAKGNIFTAKIVADDNTLRGKIH